MKLREREHKVVTNTWGDQSPDDLRKVETEQLWSMHDRVTDAVQLSYEDDDVDSLAILLSLEMKIARTLYRRL